MGVWCMMAADLLLLHLDSNRIEGECMAAGLLLLLLLLLQFLVLLHMYGKCRLGGGMGTVAASF